MTLYGAVSLFDIEDVQGSFIEGAGWGSRVAIIDYACIVSDDLVHNPAFVQHVNDKIISPWVKSGYLARIDGAPTQLDCKKTSQDKLEIGLEPPL